MLRTAALFLAASQAKVTNVEASPGCLRTLATCAHSRPLSCSTVCQEADPQDAAASLLTNAVSNAAMMPPDIATMSDGDSNKPLFEVRKRQLQQVYFGLPVANVNTTTQGVAASSDTTGLVKLNDLHNVEEAMLNKESQPENVDLLATMLVNNGTESVYGIRNANTMSTEVSNLDSPAMNTLVDGCQRVCVDDRIQNCVLENVCHEPIKLTESWNITHYCIANNGTIGGWGFRVPLSVAINPSMIESIEFQSEIFPATKIEHIVRGDSINLSLGITEDSNIRSMDNILRKCAIEDIPGTQIFANLTPTDHLDGSKVMKFNLTSPQIPAEADRVIKGDTLLIAMLGDIEALANGGPVPPPFDNTTFTITHVMNF